MCFRIKKLLKSVCALSAQFGNVKKQARGALSQTAELYFQPSESKNRVEKVSHDARLTERVREVVKKTNILQLQEFPTPSYCRCCSVTKRSDSGKAEALKALKMHFCDPSQ